MSVRARSAFALILSVSALAAGCSLPTSFKGEPKVPGGHAGCQARCTELGMELAGMVVMGEYSDGCVCRVKAEPSSAAPSTAAPPVAAPPAVPAPPPAAAPGAPLPSASSPTSALAPDERLDVGSPAVVGVAMELWARDERRRQQMRDQRMQFWGR